MSRDLLYWSGIDGATGTYLRPPLAPAELAERARREPRFGFSRTPHERASRPFKGLPEGVDPCDLSATGWGVVFARGSDPATAEALRPLLDWRRQQSGERYLELAGPNGYRSGESALDFIERLGAGPGPAQPGKIPYYLLLIGSPEEIPFELQVQLDVQYGVGRLDFDQPDDYAAYARRAVENEAENEAENERTQPVAEPPQAAFFAPRIPGDGATDALIDELAAPLAQALEQRRPKWLFERCVGELATREELASWLGGERSPALVFAACHGLGYACGEERQRALQGALVCAGWPGPGSPIEPEATFTADDLGSDGSGAPPLVFLFGCHSLGTPRDNAFDLDDDGRALPFAPQPFTSRLAQRLLTRGSLAVVGHLERAWTWSFRWREAGRQIAVFENALLRLLKGLPVGWAMEYFNQRYGELSTLLDDEMRRARAGNDRQIAQLWTARNDARNYAVLGDPAVRLGGRAVNRFEHGQALVVGVADYPRLPPACRLPASVVNDALQIHRLLGDPEHCGYPAHRLKLLSEEQATAAAIRQGLRWLAATDTKDTAIFYFSGHGLLEKTGTSERASLAAFDAGEDGSGRLDAAELAGLFDDIPAGRLLVVLDCCHAAGLGEVRASFEATLAPPVLVESVYDRLHEGEGRAILAAARREELAEAPPSLDTSLLTHHLLEALGGRGARRASGAVTLFDVFGHISEKMAASPQRPILKSILGNNFPIALLRGGQRQPSSSDSAREEQRALSRLSREPPGKTVPPSSRAARPRRRQPAPRTELRRDPRPAPAGGEPRATDGAARPAGLVAALRGRPRGDLALLARRPRLGRVGARAGALLGERWRGAVGLGNDPPLGPREAPAGLESGSLLTWHGLPFRDAAVAARLFLPTLERSGGAGFWLRRRGGEGGGEGGVLGLLRSNRGHGAALEIWRRDGFGMERLAASALPAAAKEGGWYPTRFELRDERARLHAGEVEIEARLPAELPAGRLAVAKFDESLVRIRDLELNVLTP